MSSKCEFGGQKSHFGGQIVIFESFWTQKRQFWSWDAISDARTAISEAITTRFGAQNARNSVLKGKSRFFRLRTPFWEQKQHFSGSRAASEARTAILEARIQLWRSKTAFSEQNKTLHRKQTCLLHFSRSSGAQAGPLWAHMDPKHQK